MLTTLLVLLLAVALLGTVGITCWVLGQGFWFWLLGASLQDWLLLLVPTSHCLDPAHMLALLLPLV